MKNVKFAAFFAALICILSFSSCLDSSNDGNDNYDIYNLRLTLKSSTYGANYLVSDDGFTFYPTDASVLSSFQLTNGGYLERFYGAVKFIDGEKYSADKKTYTISKVTFQSQIIYAPMTTQPDTIKGDYGIYSIPGSIWAVNGYVNIPMCFYYFNTSSIAAYQFNAYPTGFCNDTIYVNLQQSRKIETNEIASSAQLFSFSFPFDNSDFASQYSKMEHPKDSIVIKLSAKIYNQDAPIIKTTKYKWSQR